VYVRLCVRAQERVVCVISCGVCMCVQCAACACVRHKCVCGTRVCAAHVCACGMRVCVRRGERTAL
jgi:hypothetical protein